MPFDIIGGGLAYVSKHQELVDQLLQIKERKPTVKIGVSLFRARLSSEGLAFLLEQLECYSKQLVLANEFYEAFCLSQSSGQSEGEREKNLSETLIFPDRTVCSNVSSAVSCANEIFSEIKRHATFFKNDVERLGILLKVYSAIKESCAALLKSGVTDYNLFESVDFLEEILNKQSMQPYFSKP